MDSQDQNNVKEVEIVEAELIPAEETSSVPSGGEILINMEGLIKNHISSIDQLQTEVKKHKGMLDDIFNNDPTFQKHLKEAQEASKQKQQTRAQVLKQPQAADLDKKIRDLKTQLKETQSALSDYLQEYQRMSGVNEIEGDDGEVREIVYTAKLVKKGFQPN